MLLEIFHETRYDYAAPVTLAHHLAHLQPLEDAHQQLLAFDLDIDPVPAQRRDSRDAMGNAQRHFSLLLPHARLHVRASSRVRVQARFAGLQPALSPAWEAWCTVSLTKKPAPRRGSTNPRATSSSNAETTVFLP